jgi:hypothetical protein
MLNDLAKAMKALDGKKRPSAALQVDRMIRLFFQALSWQLSTDEAKGHASAQNFKPWEWNLT